MLVEAETALIGRACSVGLSLVCETRSPPLERWVAHGDLYKNHGYNP
jgi:hypothetical protein